MTKQTITFDDLNGAGSGAPISNGYEGFNWNNFYALDTVTYSSNPSGYANGTVSQPNVAYNAFGSPASFSVASGTFTVDSFYLTAAWNDGLNVQVEGLSNGTVIDSTTFVVDTSGPTLETLNWSGIDELYFDSFGGTSHGYIGSGEHFALDNLTVGSGSFIVGPGETLTVSAGETLSNILVESGGTLDVASGGTVEAVTIASGGLENVSSGGFDSGTVISSGGFEDVFGSAVSTTIENGGSQTVEAGGSVTGAVLDGVGLQEVFGFAGGAVVSAGDEQLVEPGGVASGTVVSSGGLQYVSSGGLASSSVIAGGVLDIASGGLAVAAQISAGGLESAFSGGVASGTTVLSGGFADVFGSAVSTTIAGGGSQTVESGGVASGTVISSGGLEVVLSAGVTSDTTIAGGGKLDLDDGAGARGTITFSFSGSGSGGVLRLNGSTTPAATIGGFVAGDTIDEALIPFAAGDTATLDANNLLTISGGGKSVSVQFDSSVAGKAFAVSDDGNGGVDLTFGPPAPSGLALAAASDSGVAGDAITNVAAPTITGSGAAGDTVSLFDGVTAVGSATVAADGTWSVSAGVLSSGVHSLTASQQDAGGTVGQLSAPLSLTIDQTSPVTVSATLSVSGGAAATALGIAAPSDVDNTAAALTVSVTALPSNGTVTLADGKSAVTLGESLTVAQLAGLEFTPGTGQGGSSSSFAYSVADPAGNTTSGTATVKVAANPTTSLFDFVFTYNDGKDYYLGTVADDGTFGYSSGQSKTTTAGQYTIFAKETAATTRAAGNVIVTAYSHGGPGLASSTPVKTAAKTADGTGGLGSESDTLLGTDGLSYAFSSTLEAAFTTTTLYGFVYSYADGASYAGTVADASSTGLPSSKTITDAAGNVVGFYAIFNEGLTTRAAGTVVVDRFMANGQSLLATHTSATAVDGSGGLGSEVGSITVGRVAHSFSPTSEPVVSGSPATAAVTPAPDATSVVTTEVDQVYSDIVGRLPTASELSTYSTELNDGTSLTTVRSTIANTTEAQDDLKQLYQQIFARTATSGELGTQTSDLVDGSSLASVQLSLANSSEAASDINQIYLDVLDRAVDASGQATFTAALGNETPDNLYDPAGLSGLAGVRDVVAHSGEAASDLTTLFSGVLGRDPSAAELVGMEDQLAIKGNTQATLTSDLSATGSAGGYTTIAASTGAATLSAATTPTLFGFSDIAFGNDTINGFATTRDTIQLPKSIVADLTTLQNETTSSNGGSLITLNSHQSIFISNIAPANLTAANFLFV